MVTYTITYNLNSGSISGQKTTYTIESDDFILPQPTRTGCTFTGWTGTGLNTATKSVTVSKGSSGNKTYTANWNINTYTISFIYNGITKTKTATYGSSIYLTNEWFSENKIINFHFNNGGNDIENDNTMEIGVKKAFKGWSDGKYSGVTIRENTQLTVTENRSFTALFEDYVYGSEINKQSPLSGDFDGWSPHGLSSHNFGDYTERVEDSSIYSQDNMYAISYIPITFNATNDNVAFEKNEYTKTCDSYVTTINNKEYYKTMTYKFYRGEENNNINGDLSVYSNECVGMIVKSKVIKVKGDNVVYNDNRKARFNSITTWNNCDNIIGYIMGDIDGNVEIPCDTNGAVNVSADSQTLYFKNATGPLNFNPNSISSKKINFTYF